MWSTNSATAVRAEPPSAPPGRRIREAPQPHRVWATYSSSMWLRGFPNAAPRWRRRRFRSTSSLGYVFEFVGAQPGRWRVVAHDVLRGIISTSEWVYFNYLH